MSKRKKPRRPVETGTQTEVVEHANDGVTAQTAMSADVLAQGEAIRESERALLAATQAAQIDDIETTVDVTGDTLPFPGRDDLDARTVSGVDKALEDVDSVVVHRKHLGGLIEALVFASDTPIKTSDLAKLASAPQEQVRKVIDELVQDFSGRGIHLAEVAGGWVFRTSPQYAPFVRDLTKQRPIRLSRAQVETLAIIAYRQPITRPEIDDVRGVDSGPVLKVLLERDLVRILGKRDEPGRPLIYGTTSNFLEFFGLRSLKDLPTLREFTELTDESREAYEAEIGEPPHDVRVDGPSDEAPENDEDMAPDESTDIEAGTGTREEMNGSPNDDGPAVASTDPAEDDDAR